MKASSILVMLALVTATPAMTAERSSNEGLRLYKDCMVCCAGNAETKEDRDERIEYCKKICRDVVEKVILMQ